MEGESVKEGERGEGRMRWEGERRGSEKGDVKGKERWGGSQKES